MTAPLNTAYFKATGATTARTLGDRWADVINVKDYGAVGNGVTDDAAAIQAAFNAAFGSSASPHGSAGTLTNRPVFFPAGNYIINTPLTLTRVVGGHIFGASNKSTQLSYNGSVPGGATITPIIVTNGAANLWVEKMALSISGTNTCCINLDWDNSAGGDGLHDNLFSDLLIGSATNGILVATSSNGGANNVFESVTFILCTATGIDARGSGATNQTTILGGGTQCDILYKASGGSFNIIGMAPSGNTTADLKIEANYPNMINGGRSEGPTTVDISTGLVAVRGLAWNRGSSGVFANITSGKCIIDGCTSDQGVVTGSSGSLYIRGVSFPSSFHSAYTGTVVQEI